jgi:hypothetical protein
VLCSSANVIREQRRSTGERGERAKARGARRGRKPKLTLLQPKQLAAAIIFLITFVDHALAEKGREGRDYFGVGGQSCGTWIEARKVNNTFGHGSWLLGYLSALNLWGVIGRKDALSGTDADGVYAWMDRYCQSHPLETIARGAAELARQLDQRAQ